MDGTGYGRNRQLPVGIYAFQAGDGYDLTLVKAQLASTDASGRFSMSFLIDGTFPPGAYYVVVDLSPEWDSPGLYDGKYRFNIVQPKAVCPNAPPTQLEVGQTAMVNPGPANNVREKPGLKNRLLGRLQAYEALDIQAGPLCNDGMVWWKVHSLNTGLDGWTAEGRLNDPWLSLLSNYPLDDWG